MKVHNRRRRFPAALAAAGVVALALLVPTALGGGAPSTAFSSSPWDYGTIEFGSAASKTFTLTNSGGSATRGAERYR